ncbi:hypothetical protein OKW21_002555 [Catalinimonas alkaloidigena]|uniref:DUF1987 domain-containing protein n=1 Tax=Catalinimonas alkaloidigena TaxID=1075417 RepID=UPI0024071473|nr:DUF1987 domain-containing protein [Catalinimonas alkaloidigena]MDF9797292.1 hypothetical protein [Catalinimonas alkaloidigena]
MNSLYQSKTPRTPEIILDPKNGIFEIEGRSIPENSVDFYQKVMQWMDAYRKEPNSHTKFVIKLEYFNTSSSKCLVDILRKLEKIYTDGNDVVLEWHYDDEDDDMRESGEDFEEILKIPVHMIPFRDHE